MRRSPWSRTAIAGYRPLESTEAAELAAQAATGDDAARWRFALGVAPLVRRFAWRAAKRYGRVGLMEELASEGTAEVARRCHGYDPSRASPCVFAEQVSWQGFRRVLCDLGYPVRLPAHQVEPRGAKAKPRGARTEAAGRAAWAPAEGFGVVPTWLDFETRPDDGLEAVDRADLLARVCEFRRLLTARERRVLAMRCRLGLTHREVGRWLGVSYEAARQSEAKALGKLRAALNVEAMAS